MNRRIPNRLIPLAVPFALALLAGCSDGGEAPVRAPAATAPATVPVADTGAPSTRATATGTVESVDADAGKITIAHDPVEALDWPAMTMRFKASPEQIASVRPGQAIRFDFDAAGMDGTIVSIEPRD